jgi:type III pantothenate kinase
MIFCIDSGNSRIKWGAHADGRWLAQGALGHDEAGALATLTGRWPVPDRVMLANVAGPDAAGNIRASLAAWSAHLCEVRSEARRCGVTNGYDDPARLGVDRWCALIGARRLSPLPTLVVMAGTATTIDALDGDGVFLGGFILPGLDLMRRVLASDTAGLPLAAGHHAAWPRCTDDAIVSGALEAQVGAIERAFARLEGAGKRCLLSGGNADAISRHLALPHWVAQNLPMEGLLALAREF